MAVRRLVEAAARGRPSWRVDDVHWAEPIFSTIENMAACSRRAPVLLARPARPELRETRPGWAVAEPTATLLQLERLGRTRRLAFVSAMAP